MHRVKCCELNVIIIRLLFVSLVVLADPSLKVMWKFRDEKHASHVIMFVLSRSKSSYINKRVFLKPFAYFP